MTDISLNQLAEQILESLEADALALSLEQHLEWLRGKMAEVHDDREIAERVQWFCFQGRCLYKNGRFRDAFEILRELSRFYPENPAPYCYMGFACLEQAKQEGDSLPSYSEALCHFNQALIHDHKYAPAHYGRALVDLRGFGDIGSAQKRLILIWQMNPNLASKLSSEIDEFRGLKKP